ncbi:MAG: FtsX-like permease family protein [Chitinophagaceae bacterium]|nr:MAG: FtsX-like permease family protein [Chitinophagaceae bacterium]
MIQSYFKIAFRSLWRNKAFSAINIFGLATGLATCIVIMLFVKHELSYDSYSQKADRTVRVIFRGKVQGQHMREANVFPPVAKTLLKDYPEVEEATRLNVGGAPTIVVGNNTFNEKNIALTDPNFFAFFTIPFLLGDAKTALAEPNSLVITKELSRKYFGTESPIGKVLTFKNFGKDYKITGLIEKIPDASHFHFDMFASLTELPDAASNTWMTSGYYTYLVLKPGYEYKKLQAKLPTAVDKYMGPQLTQSLGVSLKDFRAAGNDIGIFLQPLRDIHLHSDSTNDLEAGGNISYVYIFSAIALFMLVIACINFMNLSTASAGKRAREVGIRKVMGSLKSQLIWQFLIESLIITMIAILISLVFVELALPVFNKLSGKELRLSLAMSSWFVPALCITGMVTAFIAGTYPAFVLSSFNPVKVLKGKFQASRGNVSLRSGLVVFQFAISIVLMVCTAVVYSQLSYIQNKNLGYNKDQVVLIPGAQELGGKQDYLKDILRSDPRVGSFSSSGYLPAGPSYGNNFFVFEKNSADQIKTLRYDIDENYISTLGMEMKAGRNFAGDFGTDSNAIIVNETAAKALGWNNDVSGRTLTHSDNSGTVRNYHVVGVVKDFHFKSLHEKISPLVMTYAKNSGQLIVRLKSQDIAGVVNKLENAWKSLKMDRPFHYSFLDEQYYNTYKAEQNTGQILGIFAGLTIFVACLGLFGLATFTMRQRNKEIGIRKVLGASVSGIVVLLSKDFLRLIIIAFIVAVPIGWYLMNKWLQNFEYRISVAWWIFGIAGLTALVITLFTVGFRGLKAALMNPSVVLRNE